MRTFALSIHADYACAHSGACCTAGWAIPVEPPKQRALGAAILVPGPDGKCRFFDATSNLCVIHRDRGEEALPDSCRHFPRVALLDDRGVHVTLSHFCPTVAGRLLRADVPLEIVEAPTAFTARNYEGLDARGEWPPLIHDTLLFDLEGFSAWERFVVSVLAGGDSRRALQRIATAAERLREWRPDRDALTTVIARIDESPEIDPTAIERYQNVRSSAVGLVLSSIPESLRYDAAILPTRAAGPTHPAVPTDSSSERLVPADVTHAAGLEPADERVVCRYLAAKAFASWTAYQGRGVRTLVAELVVADALVRKIAAARTLLEAIRESDRLLVHLASRPDLVKAFGSVESTAASARHQIVARRRVDNVNRPPLTGPARLLL